MPVDEVGAVSFSSLFLALQQLVLPCIILFFSQLCNPAQVLAGLVISRLLLPAGRGGEGGRRSARAGRGGAGGGGGELPGCARRRL